MSNVLWIILKAGVRVHGIDSADKIWTTCCALHNMLLEVDGNDIEWDGHEGEFDFDEHADTLPFALQRLSSPGEVRNYDSSGMGPGVVTEKEEESISDEQPLVDNFYQTDQVSFNHINDVCFLTADIFQQKLIEHFDILFRKHKIVWPKRKHCKETPIGI